MGFIMVLLFVKESSMWYAAGARHTTLLCISSLTIQLHVQLTTPTVYSIIYKRVKHYRMNQSLIKKKIC